MVASLILELGHKVRLMTVRTTLTKIIIQLDENISDKINWYLTLTVNERLILKLMQRLNRIPHVVV